MSPRRLRLRVQAECRLAGGVAATSAKPGGTQRDPDGGAVSIRRVRHHEGSKDHVEG